MILVVASAAFFLSGAAALIYQVVWQRLLILFAGADVQAVTLIVTAYMGGLGLGSLAGGRWADRLGAKRSLTAFAAVEVLIAAFALVSKPFYYDFLYSWTPGTMNVALTTAVLFVSLLWPTVLMGMSLPLLARALTTSLDEVGPVVGRLYGWNTLGAASGALVATWLLLPRLGLEHSVWVGAALNAMCAAGALWLRRAAALEPRPTSQADVRVPSVDPIALNTSAMPFWGWVALYGLTGFIALSLEITWFRLLSVTLKSTAFTFGTLLAVYLGAFGLGAAVGGRLVHTSRTPGHVFVLFQTAATLYAGVVLLAALALVSAGYPARLVAYLGESEPVHVSGMISSLQYLLQGDVAAASPFFNLVGLYVVIPFMLLGPATFLLGMSVPYLQRVSHRTIDGLGQRLGLLLGANIAGSMLGSATTGWLLLPLLGTSVTLKVLVASAVLIAASTLIMGASAGRRAPALTLVAGAMALIVAFALPNNAGLWARLHGTTPRLIIHGEDGSGLSVLKLGVGNATSVFVNGLSQSWIPYAGVHTALGLLPSLLHPAPEEILVIGLGSGDTAFSAAARREVQRLTCVEIIGAQLSTLRQLARVSPDPGLVAFLSDPRVEHHVDDGRAFIRRTGRRFDIIEADALRPSSAFSGNLYSFEYFRLLAAHLKPGGLAVTWAPTERVRRTFLAAFPYVLAFDDIWVGSETPIAFDRTTIERRAAEVTPYFERAGVSVSASLGRYLQSPPEPYGPSHPRDLGDLNTDVFPRDEFALPR